MTGQTAISRGIPVRQVILRHVLRNAAIPENQVGIPQGYPLPALAAGICIVLVVVAFNVLGDRLFAYAQAARR